MTKLPKRQRTCCTSLTKFPALERTLKDWVMSQRENSRAVTTVMIRLKKKHFKLKCFKDDNVKIVFASTLNVFLLVVKTCCCFCLLPLGMPNLCPEEVGNTPNCIMVEAINQSGAHIFLRVNLEEIVARGMKRISVHVLSALTSLVI